MGTPLKSLEAFEKLCGEDAVAQVVLVTTMWDELEDDIGVERLEELKSTCWKGMVSRGSEIFKYLNTPQSAEELLERIAGKSSERRHVLLQKEISEWKKELPETEAGQALHSRLEQLAEQRLRALKRLRAEQSKFADARTTNELQKEYADLKAQLDETLKEVHALRFLPRKKGAVTRLRGILKGASFGPPPPLHLEHESSAVSNPQVSMRYYRRLGITITEITSHTLLQFT